MVQVDKAQAELTRLFNLYRLAELNRRYYGRQASHFERLQTRFLVASAILAAIALGLLLLTDATWARFTAAGLAGLSAIVTTVVQYFKWDEQARRFYFLHHSYGHLFAQIEAVMSEIRRADELTEQHIGESKLLHDAYGRIEVLDELDPDRRLIDELDAEVRKAFPEDYIWTNL
jgi:hypothetical protein